MRKVIAKISLENIRHNARCFLRWTKKPICAVVKANAYGHGAEAVVNALESVVDCFAVSLLDEALAIRVAACGKDILILTPPTTEIDAYTAMKNGFVLSVGDYSTAKLLCRCTKKYALPARVHLKVNTGMNRYGLDENTIEKTCRCLFKEKRIVVEGAYSHIYDYTQKIAEKQRLTFLERQKIIQRYFQNVTYHLGATYGAILGEQFAFDMTRIGIGLYGYFPDGAKNVSREAKQALPLRKAMSVWAEITAVRTYQFGGVGYGKATAEKGAKISVVRCGYADGFLRKRENGIYNEQRLLNNLCMDACIQRRKGKKGVYVPILKDAAMLAKQTGTISYEVLCAATRRAEMVYDDVAFCGRTNQ